MRVGEFDRFLLGSLHPSSFCLAVTAAAEPGLELAPTGEALSLPPPDATLPTRPPPWWEAEEEAADEAAEALSSQKKNVDTNSTI